MAPVFTANPRTGSPLLALRWMGTEVRRPRDRGYPALWRGRYPAAGRTPDQQDAYTVSRWLQEADLAGNLAQFFQPSLTVDERAIADIEGWMLEVRSSRRAKID